MIRTSILLTALIAVYFGDASAQKQFTSECCEEYCYSTDTVRSQTKHFASESAYQLIKGTEYKEQSTIPNCTPVKFWMFSRHGTRLPKSHTIAELPNLQSLRDEIIKNYAVKKTNPASGGLCSQDLELIRNWVLDTNITQDKTQYLTEQGWNDLKLLAQDYQKVYPHLLTPIYDESNYLFRHTDTQRTKASCQAFVEGLFGTKANESSVKVWKSLDNDTLLTPFKNCPMWVEQSEHGNDPGTEIYKFKYSEVMNKTIADVSKRLGFESSLNYKQVHLMWNMCKYESAWFLDKPSAWCTAFTLDEIKVFEYMDDLSSEYETGYASKLNPNVPCELVQDMLNRLNNNDEPRVSAYFSHSELLELVAVALGVLKDNPLPLSTNYDAMANRKWRESLLDPFGANLAAIKYDCSSNVADPSPKVKFFLNQSPLGLSWCKDGLCKLSDLISKYDYYLKADCPKIFCTENNGKLIIQGSFVLVLVSIIYNCLF